jgi:NAD(P)-dependent dehydrogenase (short-subunit alcohol dehydrogenase family)
MMSDYRFDGRVAVVTGAGRGIGRAHALLLAARGAKVVVNDLGGDKLGFGADEGPAQEVVEEITAAGGSAIANTDNVGSPDGCRALIAQAVETFGGIDILVNNAGISVFAGPAEVDEGNYERTMSVHVGGSMFCTSAAWPHFVEQGYGRVVMTTSTGMFGLPDNLTYATAKGAVVGMARSMTIAAGDTDIKINCLAPAAATRRGDQKSSISAAASQNAAMPHMDTSWVSPMMAYLAHEDCQARGEIYGAGGGRFTRIFIGEGPGYVHEGDEVPTVEEVADNWAKINDETGYYVPVSLMDWSGHFMAHRRS